jgi:hypothetical protein
VRYWSLDSSLSELGSSPQACVVNTRTDGPPQCKMVNQNGRFVTATVQNNVENEVALYVNEAVDPGHSVPSTAKAKASDSTDIAGSATNKLTKEHSARYDINYPQMLSSSKQSYRPPSF